MGNRSRFDVHPVCGMNEQVEGAATFRFSVISVKSK